MLLTTTALLSLRAARADDAPAVVRLLTEARLEAAFDPSEFVVAEQEGEVVACARLRPLAGGTHELASVAVRADLRGLGIGERLVKATLRGATGTVYTLALAPGFFARQGFHPLPEAPAALRGKAGGICASTGFVPMAWSPSVEAAVADVRRRYAEVARTRERAPEGACCPASEGGCCAQPQAPYSADELAALPQGAYLALGTGNPVREARPRPGEVVLDLGSGAGVDVLLAAREVGPEGRAIGVDFTPEMVERARRNAAGVPNAEFHLAPIERLPLPDGSVDVVVSNCVVNLSADKPAVLREARRVLRPGGRLVVSDTLRLKPPVATAVPSCDCTSGALTTDEWSAALAEAGFVDVQVHREDPDGCCGGDVGAALVRARKPA